MTGLDEEIDALLERLGLSKYKEVMEENEVSGVCLSGACTKLRYVKNNFQVGLSRGRGEPLGRPWGGELSVRWVHDGACVLCPACVVLGRSLSAPA